MAEMEIMDNVRVDALDYVVSTKYGYVKDLLKKVQETIVAEFVSLGFIIMGYTPEDKTWRVSSFAESYYKIVR